MSLRVLIAGGGIGGLALAHGLRKAGVEVAVFERDPSPTFRPQGYRIHIDAAGHTALADCLPEDLYELYIATSNRQPKNPLAFFFDDQFNQTRVGDTRAGDFEAPRAPTAVNRLTLRQILLTRLDDVLKFSSEIVSFDQDDSGVRAHLADGSVETGDVLVAADGINSVIRQQLLPQAVLFDTGVRAITGKTPLTEIEDVFPEKLDNSFTGVHGPGFRTLAMAAFKSRRPAVEAARELAPDATVSAVPDYLMWLQLARVDDIPMSEDDFWKADPDTLHKLAISMLDGWHPDLLGLVERAEVSGTFPLSIRALLPVDEWPASNVTLLGDAIHAMTPIGGRGGNTALADAAELSKQIAAADRGEVDLRTAIGQYEAQMRQYGYDAVVASLQNAAPSLGARLPDGMEPARLGPPPGMKPGAQPGGPRP